MNVRVILIKVIISTLQARFMRLAVTQRNKLLTLKIKCFCVLDFFMLDEMQKYKQIEKVVACGCTYWFVFGM